MTMAWSVKDFIREFRSEMSDQDAPYLWSDSEIIGYLDEAQRRFARITERFKDVLQVSVKATKQFASSPPSVIRVREAFLNSSGENILPCNRSDISSYLSDWRTATGTPQYLVTDLKTNSYRVVPTPVEDDIVEIHAFITPPPIESVGSVVSVTDLSEQRILLTGMRGLAYNKHDADAGSEDQAMKYMRDFATGAEQCREQDLKRTTNVRVVKYRDL